MVLRVCLHSLVCSFLIPSSEAEKSALSSTFCHLYWIFTAPFSLFCGPLLLHWGVLVVLVVLKKKKTNKNPPAVQEMGRYGFNSWVGQIRWRRQWLPTPVFLPGESHGQRSLVGCTVHSVTKDLDMTEATQHVCTAITLDPPS